MKAGIRNVESMPSNFFQMSLPYLPVHIQFVLNAHSFSEPLLSSILRFPFIFFRPHSPLTLPLPSPPFASFHVPFFLCLLCSRRRKDTAVRPTVGRVLFAARPLVMAQEAPPGELCTGRPPQVSTPALLTTSTTDQMVTNASAAASAGHLK